MQLVKVSTISAGVIVVTKGRAFTTREEVSSAEGSGLGRYWFWENMLEKKPTSAHLPLLHLVSPMEALSG